MECILTEEVVKEHIEKQYNEFRSICRNSHRGFFTKKEVEQRFVSIFNNAFFKFIEDKGFILAINTAGWVRFTEDCQLWTKGKLPASTNGEAWLLSENSEATSLDRWFFFELMAAFNVSVNYIEPLREGAYHDDYRFGHHPGEMIIGTDIWKDDGGLLSDNFHPGSTVNLTDHYGLKAVISIEEYIPCKKYDGLVSSNAYYKGHGSIEGYTKPAGSYMKLYLSDGNLSYIDFFPDKEDRKAHNSFPLWEEQIKHEEQQRKIYDETINGLIARFMQETSEWIEI